MRRDALFNIGDSRQLNLGDSPLNLGDALFNLEDQCRRRSLFSLRDTPLNLVDAQLNVRGAL